jgi:adenylate dimethylallyltransferase
MLLYLIWGPTCSGKTDIAVALARRTGWPVIVLDRVQCCPQIATGSGRPLPSELGSTQRIYLANRPLAEGIVDAGAAHARLKQEVEQRKSEFGLILEGGSISLLNKIMSDPYWSDSFLWRTHRLRLDAPDAFLGRARRRVRQMLSPGGDRLSLLEELVAHWKDATSRLVLEDVDGYRYAIRFAHDRNLPVDHLLDLSHNLREHLIEGIAQEYLEHARWQERDFPDIPSTWRLVAPNSDETDGLVFKQPALASTLPTSNEIETATTSMFR